MYDPVPQSKVKLFLLPELGPEFTQQFCYARECAKPPATSPLTDWDEEDYYVSKSVKTSMYVIYFYMANGNHDRVNLDDLDECLKQSPIEWLIHVY